MLSSADFYVPVIDQLPDLKMKGSIQTILGIMCTAVFARSVDPHLYQDNAPKIPEEEMAFLHRNKVLFSKIMQHVCLPRYQEKRCRSIWGIPRCFHYSSQRKSSATLFTFSNQDSGYQKLYPPKIPM
jgi:hypothetical protein